MLIRAGISGAVIAAVLGKIAGAHEVVQTEQFPGVGSISGYNEASNRSIESAEPQNPPSRLPTVTLVEAQAAIDSLNQ